MPPEINGLFFDGTTACRHDVLIDVLEAEQAITITGQSLEQPQYWPLSGLRALKGTSGSPQLTLMCYIGGANELSNEQARLVVSDPDFITWVKDNSPKLYHHDTDKRTFQRLAVWLLGSLAAVLLMLFVILPSLANSLAVIIPIEREVAFGKAVTNNMAWVLGEEEGVKRCDSPAGNAALGKVLNRLTVDRSLQYDIDIQVLDHSMVNAFAAPGGQVIILKGLLENADSPSEVAGVLAHELGHVENRDPLRHALRSVGSTGLFLMVFGDLTGVAMMGQHLMAASYSRDAEDKADRFALDMLSQAEVEIDGFANFFVNTLASQKQTTLPDIMSTHPGTEQRAELVKQAALEQGATRDILTRTEWQNLQTMCQ